MTKLYFILFILFTTISQITFSQESDEQENESSESIFEREEYISTRRAGGPGKVLPKNAYEKALAEMYDMQKDGAVNNTEALGSWVSVNPTGMFYQVTGSNYISGRTNAIAFHPTDPNTFYIAAAQGGVWKTTDGGIVWKVLTDHLGSIASGDIAIDPADPNILYYGTGERNYSGDSQYGAGIFKSTDAGISWNNIVTASVIGNYISKIVIDPSSTNILLSSGSGGIFRSTNSGVNWSQTMSVDISSLNMDPTNPQIIYAGSGPSASQSLIYKSTNGGVNWAQINDIVPTNVGRIQLAISPDNTNYVYASIANDGGSLNGLYRTTNGGTNWTLQNSGTNYMSSQGWYDNAVTVIPGNINGVIVGGLDIFSSTNGGTNLAQRSSWSTSTASQFAHADVHYLTFNGTTLYCCSDGGVYKSTNNGVSWTDLNLNISTLQFQSADYDPTNINKMYGGTQDNNKQTTTNSGVIWIQRTTGDGGYTVVDPVNTNFIYGQYVNGSIQRSNNSGVSFSNFTPSGSSGGLFYNPYEMAPGNHNVIVFGRANVYKTTTAQTATTSTGWSQIATTTIVGGSVSAIGISYTDVNKIYIGTSNGRILVTTNNGTSWSVQAGFNYVSDLWVDSLNDNICYASFGGTTTHVNKTTDGGLSWANVSGNLPSIGVNSILVKMSAPRTIFTGTDLGVFHSTDDGASWAPFNTGFPNVEVYDLKYKEGPKVLLAATHGRGCFRFDFNVVVKTLNLTINYEVYPALDTITVFLRNTSPPYAIVDSAKALGGDGLTQPVLFSYAANGSPYYIVVKHRNSIETWSGLTPSFSAGTMSYNFTTAVSQAYGNNMVLSNGRFSFYTGDVDQNGIVSLTDIILITNDASFFAGGYIVTDLNGDNVTNLNDILSSYNNSVMFVTTLRP
ncbi:MAG: hypothetical protein ABI462_07035 [Ignavibacteria bacterium]